MISSLAALILAFCLGLYLVPRIRGTALRLQVLDHPATPLKQHGRPVPYLGGLAVFLSFLVAAAIVAPLDPVALGLILGGSIVLVLGLVDDLGWLSIGEKLAGQTIACFVLFRAGIRIEIEFLPFWAQVALTFAWILTITNAFNLLDVMDGLAGTVAVVAALMLGAVNAANGHETHAILAFSIAGATGGFLRHNLPPARIYLGDAGSLFLGFLLGALAMTGDYSGRSDLGILCPLLVLGLALFEVPFTALMRWKKGLHPLEGSNDHPALRLRARGWSVPRILAAAAVAAVFLALAGALLMVLPPPGGWLLLGLVAALALTTGFVLAREPRAREAEGSTEKAPGDAALAPGPRPRPAQTSKVSAREAGASAGGMPSNRA